MNIIRSLKKKYSEKDTFWLESIVVAIIITGAIIYVHKWLEREYVELVERSFSVKSDKKVSTEKSRTNTIAIRRDDARNVTIYTF